MRQCLIHDNSLRFSRVTYGISTLIAFLVHNHWLVLAVSLLMAFGAFSIKLNIPYQFHALVLRKLLKERSAPIQKESGELNFVSGMTAGLLFIGFLFLYFEKFVNFAWIFILIITLLIFLACFVGFCVATLMYVFFKKIFKR
jgi:ABC-type multidrug transport system permease subunit